MLICICSKNMLTKQKRIHKTQTRKNKQVVKIKAKEQFMDIGRQLLKQKTFNVKGVPKTKIYFVQKDKCCISKKS